MVATAQRQLFSEIIHTLGERKNLMVTIFKAVCPQHHQYEALRKLLLDEFGKDGFESDLEKILEQYEVSSTGTGRNRLAGKEVPK